MATKPKRSTAKDKQAARKLAKKAAKAAATSAPRPAAQRPGRRTTLRVPPSLEREISRLARERRISQNEALVQLATLGARSADRERAAEQIAGRRRAAVMAGAGEGAGLFPDRAAAQEAILADRLA